jgi:hypothetical protein
MAHDRSRRRFSVRAGDAEQSQVVGWIAVRCRRCDGSSTIAITAPR